MAFTNTRRVDLGGGLTIILGEFTLGTGGQALTLGPGRVLFASVTPLESSTTTDSSSGLYVINYVSGSATLTMFGNGTYLIFLNTGG